MENRPMKDSGVEWIGNVPKHWENTKIKHIAIIQGGSGFPVELQGKSLGKYPFYKNSDFSSNERDLISANNYVDQEDVNNKKFTVIPSDSIVMSKIGESMKKNHRKINIDDCVIDNNLQALIIKNKEKISLEFFYYLMKIIDSNWFDNKGTIPSINNNLFRHENIYITDIKEQEKIASFLNEKVTHIDNILEDTKISIENLKIYKQSLITEVVTKGLNENADMKDSGIEWIGEIPEHWVLRKIKYVTSKIGSGKTPRGGGDVYSNDGILFLRSQNVYETGLLVKDAAYISDEIDDKMRNSRVYPGDVLLNITGGSIGRACVYPYDIQPNANVNQHVCIIRPIQASIQSSYLFYYLISHVGKNFINHYQTGGNREGLNFEQIGNITIPFFSIQEQREMVDFLDNKTEQINMLIKRKESLINDFESYKKSMIYEYITGKKEAK